MPRATIVDPTGPHPGKTIRVTPNKLDPRTVAAVAYQAGFRGSRLTLAVAVSFAENGAHDATAQHLNTDGSVDTGLWQINSVHGIPIRQLFDPQRNANAAWSISSHGTNFSPWSTYPLRSGAQMVQAQATVAALNRAGGAIKWLQNNPINSDARGGVQSPNIAEQVAHSGPFGAISDFVGKLTDSHTWFRVGEVVLGAALLVIGLLVMVRKQAMAVSKVTAVA